jgi:adenylate cyclase
MSDRSFVFADLAGYTALTEVHGDDDAARIATRFHDLARGCLPPETQLVKTIGDAVMLVSPTITEAIAVAIELARVVAAEPDFPALRIGLHVGPAVERDRDFFGATVNLAARVAGIARGGQIVCTTAIAAVAIDQDLAATQPIGPVRLKNISAPIELYILGTGHTTDELRHLDPVCRMQVVATAARARTEYAGVAIYFCSTVCAATFGAAPETFVPLLTEPGT